ncbi:MAG: chemotaxis protein CheC [Oscillibacter sp.]|nr:chemotaxis protein CheC [Oscillibacter sp.]
MEIKNYVDLSSMEIDALREIGNIGTGNAGTVLSQMIGEEVSITLPEVHIMGYNEAIEWIGGPEAVTAGVLAQLKGDINGIILTVQKLDFVNLALRAILGTEISSFSELNELQISALTEVGNIMGASFINAMSNLADMTVNLTAPAFAVDMQGAILAVPMAVYGGQSDYIMTIGGNFQCKEQKAPCRILLSPDIQSLNHLLRKLGVIDE